MESKETTLKDIVLQAVESFHYLLSKWKLIVLLGIFGGVLGFLVSFMSYPQYTANLKFVVDEEGKSKGGLVTLASSFGFGSSEGSLFSSSNLLELLKTRSMVEEALLKPVKENQKMTYAELYLKEYQMRDDWNDQLKGKKIAFAVGDKKGTFSREKDSILGSIFNELIEKKMLVISHPDENNSVLQIELKTKSEVFSKNFVGELIDVASNYYLETKTKKSKENVLMLQRQVDSVKNVVFSSMTGAASANDNIFGLNPARQVQRVSSTKQQTQAQMAGLVLQELVKNLEMAKMKLLDETPVITIIDKPIYPLKKERLGKTKGIVFGGIIAGFLIVFLMLIVRYLRSLMRE